MISVLIRWMWNVCGTYFADERQLVVAKVSFWNSRQGMGCCMHSSEGVSLQGIEPDPDEILVRIIVDPQFAILPLDAHVHSSDEWQHAMTIPVGGSFVILGTTSRGFTSEQVADGVRLTAKRWWGKLVLSREVLTVREAGELQDLADTQDDAADATVCILPTVTTATS